LIVPNNLAPSITIGQVENIERILGITLPSDFKDHYLKYNGGFPISDQYYSAEHDTFLSINSFSPIHYKYNDLDDWTIEESYKIFNLKNYFHKVL